MCIIHYVTYCIDICNRFQHSTHKSSEGNFFIHVSHYHRDYPVRRAGFQSREMDVRTTFPMLKQYSQTVLEEIQKDFFGDRDLSKLSTSQRKKMVIERVRVKERERDQESKAGGSILRGLEKGVAGF